LPFFLLLLFLFFEFQVALVASHSILQALSVLQTLVAPVRTFTPYPTRIPQKDEFSSFTYCSYQEDFYAFVALSLNPEELRLTAKRKLGIDWDPASVGEPFARQAVFVGIYDG
jgi:hypothetical protein